MTSAEKWSHFSKTKFYQEPSRSATPQDKYTTTCVLTASDSQRNGTLSLDKPPVLGSGGGAISPKATWDHHL